MNRQKTGYLIAALVVTAVFVCPPSAGAQFDPPDPLGRQISLAAYTSLSSAPAGGTVHVAIALKTVGHWHVNANKTNDEFLIPTTVSVEPPPGITVRGIVYPDGIEKKLAFSEKPLRLYEGEVLIGIVLDVSPEREPGETTVKATVSYQACDNEKCLAPTDETLTVPLRVSPPTEAIDATHAEIFDRIDFSSVTSPAGPNRGVGDSGRLGAVVGRSGYLVAFVLVFVWGLGLNLTPCVYPMIPITVSYFGGQSGGKTSRTVLLATTYALGMAAMYSTLGVLAALTGGLLGTALQNPFVISFVALVMVGLALSMFGLYDIRVPAALSNLAGRTSGRRGLVGTFLMGLTVGIVAAPCIGPFVLALLTFVGESGNPVLGFSLFFTLAMGLGLPFVFLAVLSGSISKLPRSGEWMEWIKKVFGIILLAMAIYFLEPLLHGPFYFVLLGLLFVTGGVLLGFFEKTKSTSLPFMVFKRFVGIAAPLFGLYLILNPGHIIARGAPDGGIVWQPYDDAVLQKARSNNEYVLIDFYADWCLPCKELDHRTFAPPEVVDATSGFVTLKADLTRSSSDEVMALRKRYSIKGVPTVVFIDRDGRERGDLRVFGFVDKDEFLERVDKLKSGT